MNYLTRKNFKIALIEMGISQKELAQKLGYTEQYISMLLSGKRQCEQFNKWFEINAPYLFKRGSRKR